MIVALKIVFMAAALRGFGSSYFAHQVWLIRLGSSGLAHHARSE
jgi:hypothetical protein